MYKKILTKSIAVLLLTIMVLASSGQTIKVFAEELAELEKQNKQTNNANIEFDVYFKAEEEKLHTAERKISEENSIFAEIAVKEGYLKNIKVNFSGSNLKIKEPEELAGIQKIEENSNVIFNNIENNASKVFELPIYFASTEKISVEQFNKQSEVTLTATHVNTEGKESEVKKTIKIALNWKNVSEAILEQSVTKYVPYNINGKKGFILQTSIKSSLKDNSSPIKETKIEVAIPTINGQKPEQVKVSTKGAFATNGKEDGFSEENYSYDVENGKVTIKVENKEDENKQISWKKEVTDEYIITYIFSEEALRTITAEGIRVNQKATSQITTYTSSIATTENTLDTKLTEQLSEIITFNLAKTNTLSKGYIYANYSAQEADKNETIYTQIYTADISYAEVVDKIEMQLLADNFAKEDGKIGSISNTYFKQIIINKQKMLVILGEEGKVEILSKEGTVLATLNKDSEVNAEGNIVVEMSELNINQARVVTTKPIKEGKLEVTAVKTIKTTLDYSKKQMQEFSYLELNAILKVVSGEEKLVETTMKEKIAFLEPTTKVELQVKPNALSAIAENKEVELRAILNTASLENSLFKNPIIEIVLPEDIEKIDITKTEMVFEGSKKELQIQKTELVEVNGKKAIRITITGEQTTYDLGSVTKGANIIVTTNITMKELTPTKQEKIIMNVTNEGQKIESIAEVQIVSPVGLTPVTTISNYNGSKDFVTAMNEAQKIKLESLAETTVATVRNTLLNNYANNISNVSVLGRMIFKGSKGTSGENKETTFDAPLTSEITLEGIDQNQVDIYYSENAEATKDLLKAENGWIKEPANLAAVKSYLIVMKSEIVAGSKIVIKYNITIPEKLGYDQIASIDYQVYYDNMISRTRSILQDTLQSPTIHLATATTPNLEVKVTSNVGEGVDIQEGQIIKYKVSVKNTGSTDTGAVPINIAIPKQAIYIKYQEGIESGDGDGYIEEYEKTEIATFIPGIKAGETANFEFELRARSLYELVEEFDKHEISELTDSEKTIEIITEVSAEGFEELINSTPIKNKIVEGSLTAVMSVSPGKNTLVYVGEDITYNTYITNVNEKDKTNVVVTYVLPEGLQYLSGSFNYNFEENTKNIKYDEKTRTITYTIGKMEALSDAEVSLQARVTSDTTSDTIRSSMTVKCDDGKGGKSTFITNEVQNTVQNAAAEDVLPQVDVILSCNVTADSDIAEGDILIYELSIENTGLKHISNLLIEDILPEEVKYISSSYEMEGKESTITGGVIDGKLIASASIPKGARMIYKINVKVKELSQDVDMKYITNRVNLKLQDEKGNIVQTIDKKISHNIINQNNSNPETMNRKIIGVVWYDENENGIKEDTERTMSDVKVMLLNNETGEIITDSEGYRKVITTKEDGKYEFSNLKNGEYTVIFLYDTKNYSATVRKDDISANVNSDGIDTKIEIDGIEQIAAVTQNIVIHDNSVYNIDLGLMENKRFDLKLDKYISKVTVQNPTGTVSYDYKNSQFAKRELTAGYLNNTTLVIEYKIVVTNEGGIDGYVKKIVDYLPKELKFNSELNRDWYSADNGHIYNSSLANTKIAPGESKEVTLLLSKVMTENSLGVIRNSAEIYESYNDYGIEDIDSTAGNAIESEDDMSSADLITSIRTGRTVTFIGLTLIIVVIIGAGAYVINKKVLRKI